jgi:hypothetical protein
MGDHYLNLDTRLYEDGSSGGLMICGYNSAGPVDTAVPTGPVHGESFFSDDRLVGVGGGYRRKIVRWFELLGHPLAGAESRAGPFERSIVQTNWLTDQSPNLNGRSIVPELVRARANFEFHVEQLKPRLVFFMGDCHRREVAKLVLRVARQRGVMVNVVEWPGSGTSSDVSIDLTLPPNVYDGVTADVVWMALPRALPLADAGMLSWGAVARIRSRARPPALVVLGSARPRAGGWHVETRFVDEESERWTVTDALRVARRERLRLGHAPL